MFAAKQSILIFGIPELLLELEPECRLAFGEKIIFAPVALPALSAKHIENLILKKKGKVKMAILLLPDTHISYTDYAPVYGHCCLGLFPYSNHTEIKQWLRAVRGYAQQTKKILVTGMQKPFYEKWCRKIYDSIRMGNTKNTVQLKMPFSTVKEELAKEFAKGFVLCTYCGHGRNRGWSGYRGFRWRDIEEKKMKTPSGVVLSLSCSNLKYQKSQTPFGVQWVGSGRLCSFVGCKTMVHIQPLITITNFFIEALQHKKNATIGEVMLAVQKKVLLETAIIRQEWGNFALVGNPLQVIR
jgi:hypothetical protein